MKANRKFVQADDAVSPVIAVILMVAITVVLAATVFVLVSDIGSKSGKTPPTANIDVSADQGATDVIVKHVSGESIKASEWKISVTLGATSAPAYKTCNFELEAGEQLAITTQTDGTSACTAAWTAGTGTALAAASTYHVVIVHIGSSSTMVDKTVVFS